MKTQLFLLFILITFLISPNTLSQQLSKRDIEKDLNYLDKILQTKSSYQGLNGYDYQPDLKGFLEKAGENKISTYDFGLFLTKTIGNIGDRHAYIKDFEPKDSIYFSIAFAPYQEQVLVMDYLSDKMEYTFLDSAYPYLKSINSIPIEELLRQILPAEVLSPKASYFTNAVRELRDIEKLFWTLGKDLPNPISMTLTNEQGTEKVINIDLVTRNKRARYWDERYFKNGFRLTDKQYNDSASIAELFQIENHIGYFQIPDMVAKEYNPVFFDYMNSFMSNVKQTNALIIDVRDNGGGTRDLIQELAGYFIHHDSIYVVNAARQRGKSPLKKAQKEDLHARFLFSKDEVDGREKQAIQKFMDNFQPRYELDDEKFSEFFYYMINGQKLSVGKYHYDKPIYILANERTFSAASLLVSVFKNLPNITIVGVNTDGSSGNSQHFELPNSNIRGNISTMVSFQKNGDLLDGVGTAPDFIIERNLDQIFLKEDFQLIIAKKLIPTTN